MEAVKTDIIDGRDVNVEGNKYTGPLKRIENKLIPHTSCSDGKIGVMEYQFSIYNGGFNFGLRESENATVTNIEGDIIIKVAFKEDIPYGPIEILSTKGMTHYVGQFLFAQRGFRKNDLSYLQFQMDGYGQYLHYVENNRIYYCGNFKANMKHGFGILENYHEGHRVIGHWVNDKLSGRISKQFSDGSFFCGEYRKGERGNGGQYLFSNGFKVSLPQKKKSNVEVKKDPNLDPNFLSVLKSHVEHLQNQGTSGRDYSRRKSRRMVKEQPMKYRAIWLSLVDTERLENELLASVRSFELPNNSSQVYYAFSKHILPPLSDPDFQYYRAEEGEICRLMKMFCHHVNYSFGGRHSDRYSVGYVKMDVISFLRFFVSYVLETLQSLVDRKKENSFVLKKIPSFKSLHSYLTNEVLKYIQCQCYKAIFGNYGKKYENKDRNLQRKLRSIYVSLSSYSKYCKYSIYRERMSYYINSCCKHRLDPIDWETLKAAHRMNNLLVDIVNNDDDQQQQKISDDDGGYHEEIGIIEGLNDIYRQKLDRILEDKSDLCRDHKSAIIKSLSRTKFDFKTGFSELKRGTPEFLPDLKSKLFKYRRQLKCLRISVASDYYLTVIGLGVHVYKKHFGKVEEHNRCQLYLGSLIHGFDLLKETAIRFSDEEKSHMPYLCSEQIEALVNLLNGINESTFALFKRNHEQLTFINRSISLRIKALIHILRLIRLFRQDYFKHTKQHTHQKEEEEEGEDDKQEESKGEEEEDVLSNMRKNKMETEKKFGEFLMEIPEGVLKDLTKRAKELNLGTHDMKVEKAKILNKKLQELGNRFFTGSRKKCTAALNLFDCLYFTFSTIFGMLRYRKFPYEKEFILKNVNLQTEAVMKFCDYLSDLKFYKDLGHFFKFIRASMELEKEILKAIGEKFKEVEEEKTATATTGEITPTNVVEEDDNIKKDSLRKSLLMQSIEEENLKNMVIEDENAKFDRDVFGDKLPSVDDGRKKKKENKKLAKKGTSVDIYTSGTGLKEYLIYSDATFLQARNINVIQVLGYMKNLRIENQGRLHSHMEAGEEELSEARREDEFDYLFDFSDLLSREFSRFLEQWTSLKIELQFFEKRDELKKHFNGLKELYNVSQEDIMKNESDGSADEKGILRKMHCDIRLIEKTVKMFKCEDFYPKLKICATSRALDKFISSVLLDLERKEVQKANMQLLKKVYRKNEFLDQFNSWNQKLVNRHKEELADSVSRVITSFIRGKCVKIGFSFEKTPLCLFALGVRKRFLPRYSLQAIMLNQKREEEEAVFGVKKKTVNTWELFQNDDDIIMPYNNSIQILNRLEEKTNVYDKLALLREFEVSVIGEMKEVSKREPPFEEDDKLPIILYCMMRANIKHTSEYEFLNDWMFGSFNMMVTRLETFLGYVKNLDVYNKDRAGQFQTVVGNILTPLKQFMIKKMKFVKETKNRDVNLWWLIELLDLVYTKIGFLDKDQMSVMISSDSALEANQLLLNFLKLHYRSVSVMTSYIGFNIAFDPQEDTVEIRFKIKYSPQIYMNINKRITKDFKDSISFDSI